MQHAKLSFLLALSLLIGLIPGCGWQLRGVTPLPAELRVMHLSGRETSGIYEELALQLEFNGVLLAEESVDAPISLYISEYKVDKRTLSINSLGQISEYELDGRLLVTLVRQLYEETTQIEVSSRRVLINDVTNPVATRQEEGQLKLEIDADLSSKLLRRLQRLEVTQATQ